jgi:hypothetical protein
MRRTATTVIALLVAGGCARSPEGAPNGLRVVPLAGQVSLLHDGERILLDEVTGVTPGDVVATGATGRARVELGAGRSVELAPEADLMVAAPSRTEVLEGSVLARAGGPGLSLLAGDAEITGRGAVFRVDRGFSVELGVYRGQASLPGSGVAPVPELRQATVVAGGTVPRGPQPLVVRPDDPWDAELLGPFIDLGLQLDDLQRGLTRQLPRGDGADAVLAALDEAFPRKAVEAVLEEIRAAEAVVAAVVSGQAAPVAGLPLVQALEEVVDLRLEGAQWIVVLARWRLAGVALAQELARITGLIARFVAPPAVPGGAAVTRGGGGGGGSGSGGGGGGGGSGGSGGTGGTGGTGDNGGTGGTGGDTTTGGGGSGGGGSTPPPEPTCADPVQCLVEDVVEELEDPPLPGLP